MHAQDSKIAGLPCSGSEKMCVQSCVQICVQISMNSCVEISVQISVQNVPRDSCRPQRKCQTVDTGALHLGARETHLCHRFV